MKVACFLVLALCLCVASADNWAVLVAGSNTWSNYRHQADVFHAYQVLVKNNFDKSKIIVLAYDDIANNTRNPFPGKVFNQPTFDKPGVDVYQGIKIDYSGANVTPQIFLSVLEGNKTAVKGKGTQKVLQSGPNDNVFMFFSDHGAPNLIAFPSQYLYADQLLATFDKMNGKFKKFVFYLQTCQSGSMFVKLPTTKGIYAVSAANPSQSSWGCYCSPNDVIQGKHIGSCLGDLFSVNFIEDTQASDVFSETLQQQFGKVQTKTNMSHVMKWGDVSYLSDTVSNFMAGTKRDVQTNEPKIIFNLRKGFQTIKSLFQKRTQSNFDSRYNKVKTLSQIYMREKTQQSFQQLRQQMLSMQRHDNMFSKLIDTMSLSGSYIPGQNIQCERKVLQIHEQKCGRLSDYGLIYVKYITEACENHSVEQILSKIQC